jgi:hypothetical protein
MAEAAQLELFHEVSQPGSAMARKYVTEHGLEGKVRFRNIYYPEVKADFAARGGRELPALWDGQVLTQGAEAVLRALGERA